MAVLYSVTVTPNPGIGILDVQAALAPAVSWYRISPDCWVVASWEPIDAWWARLSHLVNPAGRIFICQINPLIRGGLMDQEFWNWILAHG